MNAPFAADNLDLMKFGIGQPVPRQEDPTLLQGQGRYTDDRQPAEPGLVRDGAQPAGARHHQGHRHGRSAKRCRACCGVWTGADLNAAGYGPLKTRDRGAQARRLADEDADAPFAGHRQGALRRRPGGLRGRRDAGRGQGRGRGGVLDIESLPAVTDAREAAKPGAPHGVRRRARQRLRRLPLRRHAKVAEAFAKAAHVTRLRLVSNRIVVCAMEPRSAIAYYDAATDRYTLHAGNQGVFGLKHQMADAARHQARRRCAS